MDRRAAKELMCSRGFSLHVIGNYLLSVMMAVFEFLRYAHAVLYTIQFWQRYDAPWERHYEG